MILGIGSDLTDVRRIDRSLKRHDGRFENRLFSEVERSRARTHGTPASVYARRFAAKEACAKALGVGLRGLGASKAAPARAVGFRDILVDNDPAGRPVLELRGRAALRLAEMTPPDMKPEIHLSLSDEGDYAMAFVVLSATRLSGEG